MKSNLKNNELYKKRLENSIPGGAHTYSRGNDQFPSIAPSILKKGKGSYVWAHDNTKYLDYGMGLRSVTVGYSNEEINNEVFKEIRKGNNLTRPSLTELEAAEKLIDNFPNAQMVKFAKNGSNVTTAAIKLARAFTGKNKICVPVEQPFFSFDDWFIGSTVIKKGIPQDYINLTKRFNFGNIDSLRTILEKDNDIAAVILEPSTTIIPCNSECKINLGGEKSCFNLNCGKQNFVKKVEILCKKHGVIFILDEMITGFRFHLKGAQHYFDVNPDLSTFGKGMANGFSLSALVGKREIMELGGINKRGSERTFLLSTTHGAEMSSLRAFIKTLELYEDHKICEYLWNYGENLKNIIIECASDFGLEENFKIEGLPVLMNYITLDSQGKNDLKLRTLFNQEMIRNGVLMPWISQSFSHGERELMLTKNALNKTFSIMAEAIKNNVDDYLIDKNIIKPVFRRFN